jgi:tyrosyl-tRNA synthetase
MPEVQVKSEDGEIRLSNLLKEAGLTSSTSDAMRMIKQGAVKIDGEKIPEQMMIKVGTNHVYQVGKRKFARVEVK